MTVIFSLKISDSNSQKKEKCVLIKKISKIIQILKNKKKSIWYFDYGWKQCCHKIIYYIEYQLDQLC